MQKRTNAVTNVEARYGDGGYDDVPANDELYAEEAANDDIYGPTPESGLPASQVENVTSRFSKRFNERGVAKDVYRKTLKKIEIEELQQTQAMLQAESGAIRAAQLTQSTLKAKNIALTAKKAKGLVGWGMIAPVGTAYLFQLVFGVISLIGFGLFAAINYLKEETWYGKVISWFVNLNNFVPADKLGLVFWGLATLVAVGVFVSCLIVFYLTSVDPFPTFFSFFIASLVLAFSMIPVLNLLPSLLLWVLYVRVRSTASLFSG